MKYMKKIILIILAFLTLGLCSCTQNTDFFVNENKTYTAFDNLQSLKMDEFHSEEPYSSGTFFLGFGSYESKTDYNMYIYITFWYKPLDNAYRKARLVEDSHNCIIIVETEEDHYYISCTKGYVGGKYYDYVYRVYVPQGTVRVATDFTIE